MSIAYAEYKDGGCTIPKDGSVSDGQVYAFVTNAKSLTDSTVLAGESYSCTILKNTDKFFVFLGPAAIEVDTAEKY